MTLVQEKKIQRRPINDFNDSSLHPVLRRIYAGRQVTSIQDLDYRLDQLLAPDELPGIVEAVNILERALIADEKIIFIGDFDADGATSSALGILALKAMGAKNVTYLVPNRFEFGYGLSSEIVEVAAKMDPDLLITVDNGIADIKGVDTAKRLGLSVIITDHHLPGEQLPNADAILNPNLHNSLFPSSALAGVGVIFYLMIALRGHLRRTGWFDHRPEPKLSQYFDLVAVGTVADLVPLDKNNRTLVYRGLERINRGYCRPGIRALLEYKYGTTNHVTPSDLGYVVGPRLNAAGRLQDISLGIECLLTDDIDEARQMAYQLNQLNTQRKQIEAEMQAQAMDIVDNIQLTGVLPSGICLYEESWHQGIVGLIASRVKDRVNRPVVAFADTDDGELKGSARAITGLHIRDVLNGVQIKYPSLIIRFGGHAAAAGLSINKENYEQFQSVFSEEVGIQGGEELKRNVILSDGNLDESDLSLDFAQLLSRSGPWGQGFPEPVFDDEFDVLERKTVGDHHLKLRVRKKGGRKVVDAIGFFQNEQYRTVNMDKGVRLAYRLDINEYQGLYKPQLIVEYLQSC
ncbi:MAG: single-stranded-DNA-specific exonuclease RecJ [Arenicellales bacterium]|nr:single-stranded-DNA-specific exonuclease RecJ [Arenicellales bacterium]